jgi:hypothetical protein
MPVEEEEDFSEPASEEYPRRAEARTLWGMAKRVLRAAGRKEEVAGVERRKTRDADLAAEAIVKEGMICTVRNERSLMGCRGKESRESSGTSTRRGRNREP